MATDIANFIARSSPRFNRAAVDREHYANALAQNQIARIPQQNKAQDLAIQATEQNIGTAQRQNAAGVLGRNFSIIANSPRPREAARAFLGSADFQTAGKLAGLPVEQFAITDQDTDDAIREQALAWATALDAGAGQPAGLREFNAMTRGLSSDDKSRARRVNLGLEPRAGTASNAPKVINGVLHNPVYDEQGNVSYVPATNLGSELDAARQLAQAKATGTATGQAQGQASAGLPDALADINKMRRDIQAFRTHQGYNSVYGKSRPLTLIPGSTAADAESRRRTLDAQAFSVTIQKMRGLGALSNAEGMKVTDAFTNATNPNISEEEASRAWDEVLYTLDLAEQRAKQKAGGGGSPLDLTQLSDEQLMQIINGQ